MAKFPPPEAFDFSRPEQWPEWRQRFQRYRVAAKLNKEDGEVQVCTLLYSLGKEAEQVFKTFTFTEEEDEEDYEIVLNKLDNYFVPKVNTIHERARFHQRTQKSGETAEEYIRTLHELANTCDFGCAKEENIRDRLVIGILDKEMSEKLQMMPDLTLNKAVELVRQSEQVKKHVSEQGAASACTNLSEVAFKRQPHRDKQRHSESHADKTQSTGQKHYQKANMTYKCTRCGRVHPKNDNCPARNAECRSCKKLGHFAVVCRSRVVNEIIAPRTDERNENYFLGEITDVKDSTEAWTVKLFIQGSQIIFKIDSGADTSVIPAETFEKLVYKPKLRKPTNKLDSPGGILNCLGYFIATTKRKDKRFRFKVNVIKGPQCSHLLSRNVADAMGLIKRKEEIKASTQSSWPISPTKLDLIKQHTLQDVALQTVQTYVQAGWPKHASTVPEMVRPYYTNRHSLTVSNGLVLYNDRIVIPQQLRPEILQRIHDGHQGIVKCRERAKCSVWWPGLSSEISQMVTACAHCQELKPTQRREPLLTTTLPSRPWERIAADICELNKQNYLVVVDYFSRYIELAHLKDMSSETTVASLKNICARWGCPNELVSDNGPQFSGRIFEQFAKNYDIKHITTSPHYPQANGEAERAVQTAKRILRQTDPFLALMTYRSTPIQATGVSPAQLMLGRQIRTTMPMLETKLQPAWPDLQLIKSADARTKENYVRNYNSRYGAKPLPELQPGHSVSVKLDSQKGWTEPAVVLQKCDSPRSYLVQTESGVLRRNRRHLRPILSTTTPATDGLPQVQSENEPHSPPPRVEPERELSDPVIPVTPIRTTSSGRVVKVPRRFADYTK